MAKFKRVPMKSIEEFKWHTKIIKTFGKKALIIYTAFPRTGAPVDEEQLEKLIPDEQSRKPILDFMLDNGLIEPAEGEAAEERPKAKARKKEEEEEAAPAEEEGKVEIVPAYEEEKKEEEIAPEAEEEQPKKRYLPQKKEEQEIAPEAGEEKPAEEEEQPRKRYLPQKSREELEQEKEEEIAPAEEEEKPEEMAPEAEQPKKRYLPQKKAKEEEEEIAPEAEIQPEEEAAAPKAEEEAVPEEEEKKEEEAAPTEEEAAPEEAKPEEEEVRITSEQEEPEEEGEKGPTLTPAEMIVHDKYGEQGVLVFRLIDGKRSVADVAKESGASQDKVMEVLKYLDEVGLISLGGAGAEKEARGAAAETTEEKFAPLSEETETSPITIDEQKEGIRSAKLKPGAQFISKMKVKMSVVFKFGKSGREILEYLETRKEANAVHLSIRLSIPINTVEAVLAYLKAENYLDLGFMQREEIRKEFGYDAYIMYKRYGKKGVIFYEVIDKEIPLKQIAELISEKDPAKIIEIFKLIRDVLGIDLPINEEAIKKELFA
jgi:hypothetical protein